MWQVSLTLLEAPAVFNENAAFEMAYTDGIADLYWFMIVIEIVMIAIWKTFGFFVEASRGITSKMMIQPFFVKINITLIR